MLSTRPPILRFVRQIALQVASDVHSHSPPETNVESFHIVGTPPNAFDIRGQVELIHNTLSPDIFGVNVLVENFPFENNGVIGIMDFLVVILQVNDSTVSPTQVHVQAIDDAILQRLTMEQIREQISTEWNS